MSTPSTGKNLNQQGAACCSVEFRLFQLLPEGAFHLTFCTPSCCHGVALRGYLGLPRVIGISEYRGQMTDYPEVIPGQKSASGKFAGIDTDKRAYRH
jgi:hypothetical protein